ncbi:ATP-dependent DNA helicase [Novosphingobium mangrovi (ex Huang et al. 2023)]|uniref:ATP-dependent DNA helicase n=1 Tax=Novosphingobium mangrovi (ex Huang et al. 2023) TaxID=2976432 RepID=A0ABT2I3S7_9SPHN|nr:ATP-dependent DNA helicase [Novosphingobium mangrovi (ex Huang et al. 2023)]MCT2399461.1 ATP-dependent DNA helicase [Novosphingobium mangrovi (ex Huang et al. 2023)]
MAALPLSALHASHGGCWLRERDATRTISKGEAVMAAADTPLLILNAPLVATRLGYPDLSGLDLLELFSFVHPARFVVPTPKGLAHALDLDEPGGDADVPHLLQQAAGVLLDTCESAEWQEREGAWTALQSLVRMRWPWATLLTGRIAKPQRAERWLFSRLPEWEETPEHAQPRQVVLGETDVLGRLEHLTGAGAEQRSGQRAYAADAAYAFEPRETSGQPRVLLAQAGTGIGKTLGYLAPASLWSDLAGGTVWVSTYTKALQRQLRQESRRAWPERRADGSRPVVVRKGRENYLCLLNLEDALQGGFAGRAAILAQLVARWAAYSRDGDMIGGDLPGWLGTLFRQRGITSLTDRRGECVYAGCPHYRKCFIERASRASAGADLVIANHALVMVNAARGRDAAARPTRIVFDEGHHVFDAADSTFAAALTGTETIELRRWVIGPEKASRGRRRGLSARLADIVSYDEAGSKAITAARTAAEALPGDGWMQRIAEGSPWGPIEELLAAVRATVYARDESGGQEAGYGLETEAAGLDGAFVEIAQGARAALSDLRQPLIRLGVRLEALIEDPPDWLDGPGRARIEGARHSLSWRIDLLSAWEALLERLGGPADPEFVDWLAVERSEAREFDIGIHRHWLDPMKPFAKVVLEPAHGVIMTSATLRDGEDWDKAIARSGTGHIGVAPRLSAQESPFDYANQAEVLIVTDVPRGDIPALAAAYARLIEASGGGALGLFTAIRRLRAVHGRIADRLARAGLPLYAQHVDPIDTGTLVDIFRDDPAASLLGTDALRDGVDVPGHSLRLVVMEQVPWPRPSILHRARRLAGGGSAYDDSIIRARLAQAFGRLIRSRDDHGHFVVLSSAFPSRLLSAFPAGTPIRRISLEEALHRVSGHASGETMQEGEDVPRFL